MSTIQSRAGIQQGHGHRRRARASARRDAHQATRRINWCGIFLIDVPVGIAGLLLAGRVVPESCGERSELDLTGTALATLGLAATIQPLTEGEQHG